MSHVINKLMAYYEDKGKWTEQRERHALMAEISSVQMKLSAQMIDHFAIHSINWINTEYGAVSAGYELGQRAVAKDESGDSGAKPRRISVEKEEATSGSEYTPTESEEEEEQQEGRLAEPLELGSRHECRGISGQRRGRAATGRGQENEHGRRVVLGMG